MVSKGGLAAVGLIAVAFTVLGGASLVKPAIKNAKSTKNSITEKIKSTRSKVKESNQSG